MLLETASVGANQALSVDALVDGFTEIGQRSLQPVASHGGAPRAGLQESCLY